MVCEVQEGRVEGGLASLLGPPVLQLGEGRPPPRGDRTAGGRGEDVHLPLSFCGAHRTGLHAPPPSSADSLPPFPLRLQSGLGRDATHPHPRSEPPSPPAGCTAGENSPQTGLSLPQGTERKTAALRETNELPPSQSQLLVGAARVVPGHPEAAGGGLPCPRRKTAREEALGAGRVRSPPPPHRACSHEVRSQPRASSPTFSRPTARAGRDLL